MKLLDVIKKCSYKVRGEYNFTMLQGRVVDIKINDNGIEYIELQRYAGNGEYDDNIIHAYHANINNSGGVKGIPERIKVGSHIKLQGTITPTPERLYIYFKRNWVITDIENHAESFCFFSGYLSEYNGNYRVYQGDRYINLNLTKEQQIKMEIYFSIDSAKTRMAVFANLCGTNFDVENINLLSKITLREPKTKNIASTEAIA